MPNRSSIPASLFTMLLIAAGTPSSAAGAADGGVRTGVRRTPCPTEAIAIAPGTSIQAAVDKERPGAVFCLKDGVHRMQAVRPKDAQQFRGEGGAVLDGSRIIDGFVRQGRYWAAALRPQEVQEHGRCLPGSPLCARPDVVFLDDEPLRPAATKKDLASGRYFIDRWRGQVWLADDPAGRKVEATAALFAFRSPAADVVISNLVVEKYGSVAQYGAIQTRDGFGWTIENCEVRLNSGGGFGVGDGVAIRGCDIHHNGQIGITGSGKGIRIEGNRIRSNNTRGFDPAWEAGGAKLAASEGPIFAGNRVEANAGPGLWCDIECRNARYERNVVEDNAGIGIFHEISFAAKITDNILRHNGADGPGWFWRAEIGVAASQNVEVTGNRMTVAEGGCGVMLIDQGRRNGSGGFYKTINDAVRGNTTVFEGAPCAGGVSDTAKRNENYAVITDGGNVFDGNTYRAASPSIRARFPWGHDVTDWDGFRRKGQEAHGTLARPDAGPAFDRSSMEGDDAGTAR